MIQEMLLKMLKIIRIRYIDYNIYIRDKGKGKSFP